MWEKQKKDRFGTGEKDLFLAEGGAFGLLARAAAYGDLGGGAAAACIIGAVLSRTGNLTVGVGCTLGRAVLHGAALGLERSAAGVGTLAGLGAVYFDALEAAAALGIVGAGTDAALQICHITRLPFCGRACRWPAFRTAVIVFPKKKNLFIIYLFSVDGLFTAWYTSVCLNIK